jgi:hypothetical protein
MVLLRKGEQAAVSIAVGPAPLPSSSLPVHGRSVQRQRAEATGTLLLLLLLPSPLRLLIVSIAIAVAAAASSSRLATALTPCPWRSWRRLRYQRAGEALIALGGRLRRDGFVFERPGPGSIRHSSCSILEEGAPLGRRYLRQELRAHSHNRLGWIHLSTNPGHNTTFYAYCFLLL